MRHVAIALIMLIRETRQAWPKPPVRKNIIVDEGKSFKMTDEEVENTNLIMSQNIARGNKVSVQFDVKFADPLASKRTLIIAVKGCDRIADAIQLSVEKDTQSIKFCVDVLFPEIALSYGKWLECAVKVNGERKSLGYLGPLAQDHKPFRIAITGGMENGDAVEFIKEIRQKVIGIGGKLATTVEELLKRESEDGGRVIAMVDVPLPLPPGDGKVGERFAKDFDEFRKKRKERFVGDDDQGKDGVRKDSGHDDDDKNALSSDVSQCGTSMIAALVVVIVVFLMN